MCENCLLLNDSNSSLYGMRFFRERTESTQRETRKDQSNKQNLI